MKTVIQIIIEQRNKLSQNDFDTWILSNKKELLEKEKEQIIDATCLGKYNNIDDRQKGEQYYNQTYNL